MRSVWCVTVVCGCAYSPRSLNSARCVKRTVAVVSEGKVHCRKWISAPWSFLGRGMMNCGCLRAAAIMRRKVSPCMVAHRDWPSRTWRRRQMASSSLSGSAAHFSKSMKLSSVGTSLLEPLGTDEAAAAGAGGVTSDCACGGGGAWKGILEAISFGTGAGWECSGAFAPGTFVFSLSASILSL